MSPPRDGTGNTGQAPVPEDDGTYGGRLRVCAWPPRAQDPSRVRLVGREELAAWVLENDEEVLALNKPGDVVCHPSKAGPWSRRGTSSWRRTRRSSTG